MTAAVLAGCGLRSAPPVDATAASAMPAHPFLLFNRSEIPALRTRPAADPLLANCHRILTEFASTTSTAPARPSAETYSWTRRLEARAFLWQLTGDRQFADAAIAQMREVLGRVDPAEFYATADFHIQADPLRALALAWDWLHDALTPEQKATILPGLERWTIVCFNHTERQWWREAAYNVGAIPCAGMGLLATSIRADTTNPEVEKVYREAVRRITQNFFPTSWKPSGICYEGPNYAIVGLRPVAHFAEALRRSGGPDLMATSGARLASRYLMYQWMPAGGCAPIGDNTSYGARTFAAEYLRGLSISPDPEALWTWRTATRERSLDPLITFLWYPVGARRSDPATTGLPTSAYFEVTANRAGYFFSRSKWSDKGAAFFAYTSRFEPCNHQHYDMTSFLFGGYGRLFATHVDLYPYSHKQHGVDWCANHIVIDGGGWPRKASESSCADRNSTNESLVGLVAGEMADYVRSDAKWAYRDNSITIDNPAVRAERACLFVKSGPTPYLLILDDMQYIQPSQRYDWLWHAPNLPVSGTGTLNDPLTIEAGNASCDIQFITPATPSITIPPAPAVASPAIRAALKQITASQEGNRVQFAAVASLTATGQAKPRIVRSDVRSTNVLARGIIIEHADGTTDHIVWQSEEHRIQCGDPITAGPLQTDALTALVRVRGGKVVGYVMGEGTSLRWDGQTLVAARGDSVCATSSPASTVIEGRRRAREGLPALTPAITTINRLDRR